MFSSVVPCLFYSFLMQMVSEESSFCFLQVVVSRDIEFSLRYMLGHPEQQAVVEALDTMDRTMPDFEAVQAMLKVT
jgi:hypothetical protein